jgi:anti-sigma regulatory factor (Ser/Thr protein kinase)
VGFQHEALFYTDDQDFLAGALPFVREGVARGEAVLVALPGERLTLLRDRLGATADDVDFLDMAVVGRNPGRIIPIWQAFVDEHPGRGVRGLGEPAWPGRSEPELCECQRHEALLNVAFDAGRSWRLMCPYDTSRLSEDHVRRAAQTHPVVIQHGLPLPSPAHRAQPDPLEGELPAPPPHAEALALTLTADGLSDARAMAARHAAAAGLGHDRIAELQLAVTELAANALTHGDGDAELHVWSHPGLALAQVSSHGRIANPLAGRSRPPFSDVGGWGLYIVHQLSDLVQLRVHGSRTTVRVRMAASPPLDGRGRAALTSART